MTARDAVAAMSAYTLELREAEVKLNQNESPFDFPAELKSQLLETVAARDWNRYPDFESSLLRNALGRAYDLPAEGILTGNGSNELLAAAIGTFVAPGTRVAVPRPSFALYDKLVTIAGGVIVPVPVDPRTGLLPVDALIAANADVLVVCSPNNPTGGVLPRGGLEALRATGAVVLYDRAYGDFAFDTLPPSSDRLVTFSTFSKAWGLAALRVGWLATTPSTAREIRKVKLPYSLNIVSEAAAVLALENRRYRDVHVTRAVQERERLSRELAQVVEVFPSHANFLTFRAPDARALFDALCTRGILVRDVSGYEGLAGCLRVSVGSRTENDAFLAAMKEIV